MGVLAGDPDLISKVRGRPELNHLDRWAENENLHLLNLKYVPGRNSQG